jgi:hypothetical protein
LAERSVLKKMPSRPPSLHHDRPLVFGFVFLAIPAVFDRLQDDVAG